MATSKLTSNSCSTCIKGKGTYSCVGCSQYFCFDCLSKHRTYVQQEFDQLQNNHDLIRQQINDIKMDSTKHPLMTQIDQWEKDSIDKIKQKAQRCRTQFIRHSNVFFRQLEKKLDPITQQMKDTQQENEFNELDLNELKQRLDELDKELNQPKNVSIQQQLTSVSIRQQPISLINNISLLIPSEKG